MLRVSADRSKSGEKEGVFPVARRFGWRDRRGAFALEFAMVAPIFFLLLFVVFEVSYDLFMQEVLDNALQSTARMVQIGKTQSSINSNFVSTYFCPNDNGLLNCNNLFVRIQEVTFTQGSCTNLSSTKIGDYYDATTGTVPISGGVLQLGDYYSGAGTVGTGANIGLSPCASPNSSSGFCDAGASEMILMTAVYVAPSFLDGMVLNKVKYNGQYVRAQTSTAAFVTEPFALLSPPNPC
jgi:hypothetical protein